MPPSRPSGERFAGVVVAAGRGERFGGDAPKQFEQIGGASLIALSVRALASGAGVTGVVVVVPEDEIARRGEEVRRLPGVQAVVVGGRTRAASVRRGLEPVRESAFVLVHDAARPLASAGLVNAVIEATREHGAAVPVIPVADTIKEADGSGFVARTIDRARLRLAQTPQGSRTSWLVEALDRAEAEGVEITDEASALERAGRNVRLVTGDPANVKVTTREDLSAVRRSLGGGETTLRVGTGFDIHRVTADRPLVLAGVLFPGEMGLLGHSDADVVLHAAMDAVLGAAGLDDIGALFPPGDPRFSGADSADLARQVARKVSEAGYGIANLDLTLLAERPRIRDRVGEMRGRVASCFGLSPGQVGLKASTLEGLGSLGRAEGIGCQAVALLFRRGGEP